MHVLWRQNCFISVYLNTLPRGLHFSKIEKDKILDSKDAHYNGTEIHEKSEDPRNSVTAFSLTMVAITQNSKQKTKRYFLRQER